MTPSWFSSGNRQLGIQFIVAGLIMLSLTVVWLAVPMEELFIIQGNTFLENGELDFANRHYLIALQYDSQNGQAKLQMARAANRAGEPQRALEILANVGEYSHPAHLNMERGWSYYALGDVTSAEQHFATALQEMQNNANAYSVDDFGNAYAAMGWVYYLILGCDAALGWFDVAVTTTANLAIIERGQELCDG